MHVRHARPQDMDELLRLYEERMDVYLRYEPRLPSFADSHESWRESVLTWLDQDQVAVLVVERDTQLIGYMLAWVWQNPPFSHPPQVGIITEMSVDGHCKQGGVGKALLNAASEWFRAQGIDRIEVRVPRQQAIEQAFWRAVGAKLYFDHMSYRLK